MAKEQLKTASELEDDDINTGSDDDEICPSCGIDLENGSCPECGFVSGELEKDEPESGFGYEEAR
ncbi:hypothetical protein HZC33_00675 [Candidatus Wolfebacteria bacterium]|nr:hypothetical protein [Candidatus Wolfebacteria bacterium]